MFWGRQWSEKPWCVIGRALFYCVHLPKHDMIQLFSRLWFGIKENLLHDSLLSQPSQYFCLIMALSQACFEIFLVYIFVLIKHHIFF